MSENFALIGVRMFQEVEAMGSAMLRTSTEQLRADQKNQEKLTKEKEDLIRRETEAAATQKSWEQVTSALEYVGYLTMLATAYNVTGAAGHVLRVAAAIGLINRFAQDTGITESLLQNFVQSRQTQEQIQTTLRVMATAASLAGLFLLWQTGPIAQLPSPDEFVRQMETVGAVTGLVAAGSNTGVKWAEWRRATILADLKHLDARMLLQATEFRERMQGVERGNKTLGSAIRSSQAILANAHVQLDE